MKSLWMIVLLLLWPVLAGASVEEARVLIEEGAVVIDVRSPEEYASGHLEGALNIPHTEIADRLKELPENEKSVVVYCRSGRRSEIAAGVLREKGYTRVVNGGAYEALKQAIGR